MKRYLQTKYIGTFCLFFLLIHSASAQITFQKAYGDSLWNLGFSMQQTSDNGFIMGGYSYVASGDQDFYLVKTDDNGVKKWAKTYGGFGNDIGRSVRAIADGGFLEVGATNSFNALGYDIYAVKTDANGDTIWTRMYGSGGDDLGYCGIETNDGGYAIAGTVGSLITLIKTNANGDTLWTKIYAIPGSSVATVVQQTNDGGYMIAGHTNAYGAGSTDFLLIKTNSTGDMVWAKTYGGTAKEEAYGAQQTSDSGYVIAGQSFSFGGEFFYVVKTDKNGVVSWSRTYGGTGGDDAYSVQQTKDGGFIVAGVTYSFGGSGDIYLVKTDAAGNDLWSYNYGSLNYDYGYSVQQTSDNGYAVLGYTQSFGSGGYDLYLVKTDSTGLTGCLETQEVSLTGTPATQTNTVPSAVTVSISTVGHPASVVGNVGNETTQCFFVGMQEQNGMADDAFQIFPNPSSGRFSIALKHQTSKSSFVEVENMLGEIVFEKSFAASEETTVDMNSQPAGVYFVRVTNGVKTEVRKMVVN